MVKTIDILEWLNAMLRCDAFEDLGPNGLQVPGRGYVDHVVTGVSATRELIVRAVDAGAGLTIVHHGLFWNFQGRALTPTLAGRLRPLLGADVNLAAYHLPLDAHPEHGNNALLAEALGCDSHEEFGIGRIGRFGGDGIAVADLVARVERVTRRPPLVFAAGPDRVRSIGLVSGSAASDLPKAIALGLDAFLTGEPKEHVMADAEEAGIHFIAAGHYATETFGVRRLGELIEAQFGLRHTFVDLPNPV